MTESPRPPIRIAVLLSGSGRTLQNLIDQRAAGTFQADLVTAVSSVAGAGGLEVATRAGIPAHVVRRREYTSDHDFSDAIYRTIAPYQPELIVLAGFLRRLLVAPAWTGRILNIHPALLPESGAAGRGFYGERVHAAVLAGKAAESGATVHVVDNDYDSGPVIERAVVPVEPGDTAASLAARVFAAECRLYPAAIQTYVRNHPELFGPDRS